MHAALARNPLPPTRLPAWLPHHPHPRPHRPHHRRPLHHQRPSSLTHWNIRQSGQASHRPQRHQVQEYIGEGVCSVGFVSLVRVCFFLKVVCSTGMVVSFRWLYSSLYWFWKVPFTFRYFLYLCELVWTSLDIYLNLTNITWYFYFNGPCIQYYLIAFLLNLFPFTLFESPYILCN